MDTANTTTETTELAAFRAQIDALDDKLIALLKERIGVVAQVGALKRKSAQGLCPIRAGREAEMVRRIMREFAGSKFAALGAAAIWRLIIGTSTTVEAPLAISAYTPDREPELYWLAREYFGPAAQFSRQPQVKRVIGDVLGGKATIGILPMLRSSDTSYWWTNLLNQGEDAPKIFAHIPFITHDTMGKDAPAALAIARILPEASGDDQTLIVLDAEHNVSQNKLQTAFAQAKLAANWLSIATIHPASRHHLIEVKGFFSLEHPTLQELINGLGNAIIRAYYLGNYATPINNGKAISSNEHKLSSYASLTQ